MAASMTDDELRKKLSDYGYNVGPVTQSTRFIYMKKLKDLEDKKKNAFKAQTQKPLATHSLITFSGSSDESESETPHDLKSTRKLRRRRQSLQPLTDTVGTNGGLYSNKRDTEKPISPSASYTPLSSFGNSNSYKQYLGLGSTPRYSPSSSSVGSTPKHKFHAGTESLLSNRTPTSFSSSFSENSVGSSVISNKNATYDYVSPSTLRRKDSITATANGSKDVYFRSHFRNVDNPSSITNSHCISMILLGVVILFFAVLGILYLGVRHKEKSLQPQLAECEEEAHHGQIHCDKKDNSEQVLMVLNLIRKQLRYVAGYYDCGHYDDPERRKMTLSEMKSFLKDNEVYVREPFENTTFGISLKLFVEHSSLGIRLYNRENILTSNISEVRWLDSIGGDKSFFCRLKQAFGIVLYQLFLGAAVIVALGMISVGTYWQWKKNKEFHKQVMAMTEKILYEVQRNYEESLKSTEIKPYLAIPHVRDMLIPLSERKQMLPVWDKAVKFLNSHDSRVRVECQTIEGEEFEVWRWLQPQALRENSKKLWQGQAFENLDTGLNAHIHSPTPCLKIRNMFDPDVEYGDDWHVHIQDAILEKCEGINGIVHIKVDTSSREGCVYVKCNSPAVAGQVFRALHGWWFDGNLVTVRYLRLERYHERFPEAANAKIPLKPSNNKRLSLGLPMFKSFMEH